MKIYVYIYTGLGCTTHFSLIHKVWVDLINERQQKTHSLLSQESEFHGINLKINRENYNYLNLTQLLDLVYPFGL